MVTKADLKKPTKFTKSVQYINTFTCEDCKIAFSVYFTRKRYQSRHFYNADCPGCGKIQTVQLHLKNDPKAAMLLSTYIAAHQQPPVSEVVDNG